VSRGQFEQKSLVMLQHNSKTQMHAIEKTDGSSLKSGDGQD
jgi:hypothetical protein